MLITSLFKMKYTNYKTRCCCQLKRYEQSDNYMS